LRYFVSNWRKLLLYKEVHKTPNIEKMFYARIREAETIKIIFEGIKDLVDSINLVVCPTNIYFQSMDKSGICLIYFLLSCDAFEKYRCDKENILGIYLPDFLKILHCGKKDDILTFSCEEGVEKLFIKFESNGK
jgi:proliferating cell nuclear antigen